MEKQALTEGRQLQKVTRKIEKIKRERDVLHRTYVKTLGMLCQCGYAEHKCNHSNVYRIEMKSLA